MGGRISRGPPLPEPAAAPCSPGAPKVVLVDRDSELARPRQLVLEHHEILRKGGEARLTLASHPGCAVVQIDPTPRGPYKVWGSAWMVHDLGIGPAAKAIVLRGEQFKGAFYLVRDSDHRVLNVSEWKAEDGKPLELIREQRDPDPHGKTMSAYGKPGGRAFLVNSDGTVSPRDAPQLVLGVELPDITLVAAGSPNRCIFEHAAALRAGAGTRPLTLANYPGFGVAAKFRPKRIPQWQVHYQHLGIAAAPEAISVRMEPAQNIKGGKRSNRPCFVVSEHPSSARYVLDVPFDKRVEGSGGIPLAVIHFDHGRDKEIGNKARDWVINDDDTISPTHSPHLVIGLRPGKSLYPLDPTGAGTGAGDKAAAARARARADWRPSAPPPTYGDLSQTAAEPERLMMRDAGNPAINGSYTWFPNATARSMGLKDTLGCEEGIWVNDSKNGSWIGFQDCGKLAQHGGPRPEWNKWVVFDRVGVTYAAHSGGLTGVRPRQGFWELADWAVKFGLGTAGPAPVPVLNFEPHRTVASPSAPFTQTLPAASNTAKLGGESAPPSGQHGLPNAAPPAYAEVVGAPPAPASGPSLDDIVQLIKRELLIDGTTIEVVDKCCATFGLAVSPSAPLVTRARLCYAELVRPGASV